MCRTKLLLLSLLCGGLVQAAEVNGWWDLARITTPAAPATSFSRLSVNVTTGVISCLNADSTNCFNVNMSAAAAPALPANTNFYTYSNSSPSTNGYPKLTYARCAVLIDSEVVGINGTTDGTNYATIRGDVGTTPAAHSAGAPITLLKYSGIRGLFRANAQQVTSDIVRQVGTARLNTLISQKAALDVLIAALQASLGL